jgi:hypothetical protein
MGTHRPVFPNDRDFFKNSIVIIHYYWEKRGHMLKSLLLNIKNISSHSGRQEQKKSRIRAKIATRIFPLSSCHACDYPRMV